MSFLSDSTVDDIFYDNLTLGLTRILAQTNGLQNVEVDKRNPCERMQLSSWEQRHCCLLPQDLRLFYLSTDGFKLTWKYLYTENVLSLGNMGINSIGELKRIGGIKNQGDIECPNLLDVEIIQQYDLSKPNFGIKCKVFELDSCQKNGRICLVYLDKMDSELDRREQPKIWLLDRSYEWHFLADTFSQYFRMMLVHQGLPQWQYRFTPIGLTPFAEQIMTLLAPHLTMPESLNFNILSDPSSANHLDPNVLKNQKTKGVKKKETKNLKS